MKTSQVNGDDSGSHALNGDDSGSHALNGGAKAPSVGAEGADSAAVVAAARQPAKARHEPAFNPPQADPPVPRDEHHGKGGMYALVDGKRVPADNDGNPLPPKGRK